ALERQQRGLDHVWKRHVPEAAQLVTLMPFAGPAAVEGFLARTGETLKKNFGVVLGKDDVTWRTEALSSSLSPLGLIERLVEEQRRE
ncbi:MAG TPA: PelD GGDEF domain-containing protein, partial [Dongiaceae bacterium]|nr:PelD GGDEF domain-containing protein [Dongiaceae bacterium]